MERVFVGMMCELENACQVQQVGEDCGLVYLVCRRCYACSLNANAMPKTRDKEYCINARKIN